MFPEAMVDLPERFAVMLRQEATTYRCEDYLSPSYQRKQHDEGATSMMVSSGTATAAASPPSSGSSASAASTASSSSSSGGVNEDWRSKICEWSYQVIDHFDYNREIVSISLSYLDRYLCKRPVNKRTFQLVAMTTLYLACKLYDPHKLRMSSLIELSRGYFTEEHITAMEESILNKLSWQVHPPTPLTFCRHLILLLPPNSVSPSVWHDMMEVAKFLTELSVIDYYFVTRKPSAVGVAALLTAMEGVDEYRLSAQSKEAFVDNVCRTAGIDCASDPEVVECRERLRAMYYEGGVYQQQQEAEAAAAASQAARSRSRDREAERIASVSPVSVAGIVNVDMGQQMAHGAGGCQGHHQGDQRRQDERREAAPTRSYGVVASGPL